MIVELPSYAAAEAFNAAKARFHALVVASMQQRATVEQQRQIDEARDRLKRAGEALARARMVNA